MEGEICAMDSLWIENGNVVLPDRVVKASLLVRENRRHL